MHPLVYSMLNYTIPHTSEHLEVTTSKVNFTLHWPVIIPLTHVNIFRKGLGTRSEYPSKVPFSSELARAEQD